MKRALVHWVFPSPPPKRGGIKKNHKKVLIGPRDPRRLPHDTINTEATQKKKLQVHSSVGEEGECGGVDSFIKYIRNNEQIGEG